jgi:inorganic pyrophosphatase
MRTIEVVIESPRTSQAKYKYDPKEKVFKLKKLLPLGMVFPYDFGFIPDTEGEDGDPLDVVMLCEFATFTGAHVKCRLIGVLEGEQQEDDRKPIRNDRFFVVPVGSITYANIVTIEQLGKEHNDQLEEFFINYNKVEGKTFKALGIVDADKGYKLIKKQIA